MSLKNCLIVLWVYIMYVLGIWLFLSGFLLKRIVIHQNSTSIINIGSNISCRDIFSLQSLHNEFVEAMSSSTTVEHGFKREIKRSHLRRFNKAVIIIIDALRHDFAIHTSEKIMSKEFYSNKMPIFKRLVKKYPRNALLLPLLADPPTTTLQRLKGLTTGSLPTFIDMSLNFHSYEIIEDSVIRQMNHFNKSIVFMGDDTWNSIFPSHFTRSYPYPSFNVKDLDTVDNGVLDHLFKELHTNSTDVLIAHFLGVDHCGHRYGPKHPEMSRKLLQMNNVIERVVAELDEDTILIVLGDHGMTDSGDHGGDSIKETLTALFLFSPSKVIFNKSVIDLLTPSQIDIVPTLSLLLGLPIPFSNLGSVIPELFAINSKICFNKAIDAVLGGALAAAENSLQIYRFLKTYSSVSSEFDYSFVIAAEEKLKIISLLWENISNNFTENLQTISEIKNGYIEYAKSIKSLCERKWATFNFELIVIGLIILGFAVLCNLWIADRVTSKCFIIIPTSVLFLFLHVSLYLFCSFHLWFPAAFFISCLFIKFVKLYYDDIVDGILNLLNVPSLFLIILFLSCFSNSFIIYEDRFTLFLLQSLILYRFYPCLINLLRYNLQQFIGKNKASKRNLKLKYFELLLFMCLMIINGMGSVFFKCREEQVPCENYNFILSLDKLHMPQSYKTLRLFISWASIIIPAVVYMYVSSYRNSVKARTAASISIRYGIFFVCVFTCLRWWLNIVSQEAVDRILKGNEVSLTRGAAFFILIMCVAILMFPILVEKPWTIASREIYGESLGTFLFIISQLLYLVAGDAISSSVMLMSTSILLYVTLIDSSMNPVDNQVWVDVLIWSLMARFWFFASAHQSTFTAIQWDAAFLLHHKEIYSYAISGVLVLLNTFSSFVLHGLAFPCILIWTQSTACSSISILRLQMKFLFCYGIKLLGYAVAGVILRRHLMLWKVFLPRLLFEVLGMLVMMISTCIGHYFIVSVISYYHKLIRKNLSHMFSDKDQ